MQRLTHGGARLMETIGGGFASALAVAYQRADSGNRARIEAAFPDLIERYNTLADTEARIAKAAAELAGEAV